MERDDTAGLVGGAINNEESSLVVYCELECARWTSNLCCLRFSFSASSWTALRLSSDACRANAAAETFLDLPRRCDGGGGFWYQVLRGGRLAASMR